MTILTGSDVLITGGPGSFGKAFVRNLLAEHDPARLVIFSRDELKQYEARQLFDDDPRLRTELVFRRTRSGPLGLIDELARRRANRRRPPRVR